MERSSEIKPEKVILMLMKSRWRNGETLNIVLYIHV